MRSTQGQHSRYTNLREPAATQAFSILACLVLQRGQFGHDLSYCLAAVNIVVFQRMRVDRHRDIRTAVTCSLCNIRNTDTCLELQTYRSMPELMRVYPREMILVEKSAQPFSHGIRTEIFPRV